MGKQSFGPGWYKVLESARRLASRKTRFTAAELADEAQIETGPKGTSARAIASAWLSKFAAWGYVQAVDKVQGDSVRKVSVYEITEKGRTCKVKRGGRELLGALVECFRTWEGCRGTRGEGEAWRDVTKIVKEAEDLLSQKD